MRKVTVSGVLFVAALLVATPVFAQLATTTTLVGTVTDSSDAALVGADVTAINQATQDKYHAATNASGAYTLPFVRIGTYTIAVEAQGFERAARENVVVESDQTVRTNFTMQVGAVTQEVMVTGTTPPIATDDASVSEILTTRDITTLPLTGRDVLKLATTTAGVRLNGDSPNGVPPGETFTGAGVRSIQNSVSEDGISIVNNLITTVNFRPSAESVSEMHVQTGTYSAQYGNYLGVHMNVVTKGGTNKLHGALFEYLRNDALDAQAHFTPQDQPKNPLRQNQFGAELDGPVVIPGLYNGTNKTFFMGSYEGLRLRQKSNSIDSVLTPKMRTGDFSEIPTQINDPFTGAAFSGNIIPANLLSPQALAALQFMPLPNAPGVVDNFNNINTTQNDFDQVITRVDENVSDAVRLTFRYSYLNGRPNSTSLNPYDGTFTPNNQNNFLFSYTHILTPAMVNDFRFGRNKVRTDTVTIFKQQPALQSKLQNLGIAGYEVRSDDPGLPNFNITSYDTAGDGANWYQTDQTWQFSDNLSITHGSHSFVMGGELTRDRTDRIANNDSRGRFNFAGTLSGYAAADFMLGLPESDVSGAAQLASAGQQWRHAFFFVDKWDLTRKLTLNLGIRYELPTVPITPTGYATTLNADQSALIPSSPPVKGYKLTNPDHNNWAPRIGVAYRISDKWVARGGFGLYYNPNQTNSYTLLSLNPPFSLIASFNTDKTNPTLSLANPYPSGSATGGTSTPDVVAVGPNWPTANMRQWSADIERGLWSGAGLDVQYLGSNSYNLDTSYYINTPTPGPGAIQARRPNQRWGNIRWLYNGAIANYNALNVILRQRTSHGLSFQASYTWSHTLDEANNSNAGGRPLNPYDFRFDYGNADWDIRQRFVASYSYQLPFFTHSGSGLLRAIAGGWEASGVTGLETGLPFNVVVSGDFANTGSPNQRPDVVGAFSANCNGSHLTNCIAGAFKLPPKIDATTPATDYRYGTMRRNQLHGPGSVITDFAFRKAFAFTERVSLRLGIEAFNLFNTPTFSNPRSTFFATGTSTFGSINSIRSGTNAREVQLALRFGF